MKNTFDLIVLGAGSGGLAAAKRAAKYGARVAIVEGDLVGGTCVIRGCVPKKLLVYGSKYNEYLSNAESFGVQVSNVNFDLETLWRNVRKEVERLHEIHIGLLEKAGITLFNGWASFSSPNSVCIKKTQDQTNFLEISARDILIAVGGIPVRPNIIGSSLGLVSDQVFEKTKFPKKIVIVGAGFIACEFACIFNNLGVDVIQLVRGSRLLKGFDEELALALQSQMNSNGIEIRFKTSVNSIKGEIGNLKVILEDKNTINCCETLFATGRRPFTENLNLKVAGVETDGATIKVDNLNLTSSPNIYAIGDVTNNVNLTPVAIEEGRVLIDRLYGKQSRKINYDLIPKAVFSQPEIASIGLSEADAVSKYGENNIKTYRSTFRPMSQSLAKNNKQCFLKLIVEKSTDKIIGCHMAGENSAEVIQMASIALSMGAKKIDFDRTMALHPTIAEEFVTMT